MFVEERLVHFPVLFFEQEVSALERLRKKFIIDKELVHEIDELLTLEGEPDGSIRILGKDPRLADLARKIDPGGHARIREQGDKERAALLVLETGRLELGFELFLVGGEWSFLVLGIFFLAPWREDQVAPVVLCRIERGKSDRGALKMEFKLGQVLEISGSLELDLAVPAELVGNVLPAIHSLRIGQFLEDRFLDLGFHVKLLLVLHEEFHRCRTDPRGDDLSRSVGIERDFLLDLEATRQGRAEEEEGQCDPANVHDAPSCR